MNFRDIFSLAYRMVRSNKLRTGLTVAIIAFGIMALVGIITAIKAMNQKFTESFSTMGANAFTIRFKERNIRFGGGDNSDVRLSKKTSRKEKKSNLGKIITRDEAEFFLKYYHFPSDISASVFSGRNNILSKGSRKTSPNVAMFGGDEKYLLLNGMKLAAGRNMNKTDVEAGRNVCLLGYDIASKLFKEGIEKAVNGEVRVNDIPYRVLGVIGSRGSTFGFSRDDVVI